MERTASRVASPRIYAPGRPRIPEEKYCDRKSLANPSDPLSGHALVAFRDGQRTRVGFAQKFKLEFKSPPRAPVEGSKGTEWDVESEVKKDLTRPWKWYKG